MKACNLVLGMVLAANVLTAQGDVFTTAATTAAITTANTIMLASANNARFSEKTGEKKMKTFDKKDVFSWSNAEDAKQYIGKYCYFADNLQYLKNQVNQDITFKLKSVFNIDSYPVQGVFCDIDNDYWGLCLPADKVKKVEEKKWRAFEDHNEFIAWVGKDVGEVIYIRKINFEYERNVLITELSHESVCLGATYYTYDELFNQYEWLNPRNEWQPFGVEE